MLRVIVVIAIERKLTSVYFFNALVTRFSVK